MIKSRKTGGNLFLLAEAYAAAHGGISISEVQRAFAPGYRAAADVVDALIAAGIVGAYNKDNRRPYTGVQV